MLKELQNRLRELSWLVEESGTDHLPRVVNGFDVNIRGYSNSTLTLAVYKETNNEFAIEQATFMMFLSERVCPKILALNGTGYVMEYLSPVRTGRDSLVIQEAFLLNEVWNRSLEDVPYVKQIGDVSWYGELGESIGVTIPGWALDDPCLIHGDPTLDNTLEDRWGLIRITDPIPPHRLIRPSIRAVDHGKMLQSFLGWEVVLRGTRRIEYEWPDFMQDYDTARRAVFWAMVALKRITLRNDKSNAGKWAKRVGKELEPWCM